MIGSLECSLSGYLCVVVPARSYEYLLECSLSGYLCVVVPARSYEYFIIVPTITYSLTVSLFLHVRHVQLKQYTCSYSSTYKRVSRCIATNE